MDMPQSGNTICTLAGSLTSRKMARYILPSCFTVQCSPLAKLSAASGVSWKIDCVALVVTTKFLCKVYGTNAIITITCQFYDFRPILFVLDCYGAAGPALCSFHYRRVLFKRQHHLIKVKVPFSAFSITLNFSSETYVSLPKLLRCFLKKIHQATILSSFSIIPLSTIGDMPSALSMHIYCGPAK